MYYRKYQIEIFKYSKMASVTRSNLKMETLNQRHE